MEVLMLIQAGTSSTKKVPYIYCFLESNWKAHEVSSCCSAVFVPPCWGDANLVYQETELAEPTNVG